MAEFKSLKNKLVDFGIRADSFKNDAGEDVNFEQLVIRAEIDGDVEDIVISGNSAPKPKMLRIMLGGAKNVDPEQGIL